MANGRNTLWRQGSILPKEAAKNFLVPNDKPTESLFIVIVSHDCDLANTLETHLIEFKHSSQPITIELPADKIKLAKQDLTDYQPRKDLYLESKNLHILQRWLAARYRRSAFPDEFNKRLKKTDLDNQLSKILRPLGSFIPAIFFDLDNGEEVERMDPDDLYELEIIILHTTDEDYESAQNMALQAKQKIEKNFKEKLQTKDGHKWQYIELKNCSVISDEALTYRQSTIFKQWRMEHLSLKESPIQPIME